MGIVIDSSVIMAAEGQGLSLNIPNSNKQIYVSVVAIAELLLGVQKTDNQEQQIRRSAFVEYIIASFDNLPFEQESAKVYARIAQNLYKKGITISVHDMLIASTAITYGYPLLTLNEKKLKLIPGLQILNA